MSTYDGYGYDDEPRRYRNVSDESYYLATVVHD